VHGRLINAKSAQQHITQIKNMLGHPASKRQADADVLLDKDYVLDKFLNGYAVERHYQSGTI